MLSQEHPPIRTGGDRGQETGDTNPGLMSPVSYPEGGSEGSRTPSSAFTAPRASRYTTRRIAPPRAGQ